LISIFEFWNKIPIHLIKILIVIRTDRISLYGDDVGIIDVFRYLPIYTAIHVNRY